MPGKQNGGDSFVVFDPEDPDYIKDLQRPAAIKEDLSEMGRRKRVQQILESKGFCHELEELIKHESDNNKIDPEHLQTLQRLSELTLHQGQWNAVSSLHGIASSTVIPITDLRDSTVYSKQEKILRNKLATLHRLVDLFQWSQGIYNHITLKASADADEVLINPFGLLYHEVTAGSLVKLTLDGQVLDPGTTKMGINKAGYILHSAIHENRPNIRCVIHMHTAVVGAVSSMKCGLLPICQEAMIVGPVSYHEYQGILDEENERVAIARDLGPVNKVLILRNHGFVSCGETVEEALHLAWNVILACEMQILIMHNNGLLLCGDSVEESFHLAKNLIIACDHQIRASRAGLDNLIIPDKVAQQRAFTTAKRGGGGVYKSPSKNDDRSVEWRVGELEWEAWMRMLDNAGFRTGHAYRQPLLRSKTVHLLATSLHQDVASPPSASSMGELDESNPEMMAAHRVSLLKREQDRNRWLNSPNSYQKVQTYETGTDHPKVIVKWVQDPNSPAHSTSMKIDSTQQFSPFGQNPQEFKDKQRAIKENRRQGATSAGPQSLVLDGIGQEEMAHIRDAEATGMGLQERQVMIGTASKGIIDRDYQHNAQVYRQLYTPNPFASETDDDIRKYMTEIEAKSSHDGPISPLDGADSPSHETASLMQVARKHRHRVLESVNNSVETPDGTLNDDGVPTSRMTEVVKLSKDPSFLEENYRVTRISHSKSHDTSVTKSNLKAASDDEHDNAKNGKKKKKRGFFSFGRRKN